MEHTDSWTLPLSVEGTQALLAERDTPPPRTLSRLATLARVREAMRAIGATRTPRGER